MKIERSVERVDKSSEIKNIKQDPGAARAKPDLIKPAEPAVKVEISQRAQDLAKKGPVSVTSTKQALTGPSHSDAELSQFARVEQQREALTKQRVANEQQLQSTVKRIRGEGAAQPDKAS